MPAIRRDGSAKKGRGAIAVFVADHGIAEEGVSAFPKAVTLEMLRNLAGGGAAISVLAKRFGYELRVIDVGVEADSSAEPFAGVTYRRIGPGTRNFLKSIAMMRDEAIRAIEVGIDVAREFAAVGVTLIGIGEMGIANSTSAAAVMSAVTGIPPARLAGRGTGLDNAGWKHKVNVIERGLALHRDALSDGVAILARSAVSKLPRWREYVSAPQRRMFRWWSTASSRRPPRSRRMRSLRDSRSICFSAIARPKEAIARRSNGFTRGRSSISICDSAKALQRPSRCRSSKSALDLFHQMATFQGAGVSGKIR